MGNGEVGLNVAAALVEALSRATDGPKHEVRTSQMSAKEAKTLAKWKTRNTHPATDSVDLELAKAFNEFVVKAVAVVTSPGANDAMKALADAREVAHNKFHKLLEAKMATDKVSNVDLAYGIMLDKYIDLFNSSSRLLIDAGMSDVIGHKPEKRGNKWGLCISKFM